MFTGKERDAETGWTSLSPATILRPKVGSLPPDEFKGGFLDAFTGQAAFQTARCLMRISATHTLNKYAYVRNNPLRYRPERVLYRGLVHWGGDSIHRRCSCDRRFYRISLGVSFQRDALVPY